MTSNTNANTITTQQISIDNGNTYTTAQEAWDEIEARGLWDQLVNLMDDQIREAVAREGYDTEVEFLARYLELAQSPLILG